MKKSVCFFLFCALSLACTTFEIISKEGPLVGKSYDWEKGHGYVLTNRRHL